MDEISRAVDAYEHFEGRSPIKVNDLGVVDLDALWTTLNPSKEPIVNSNSHIQISLGRRWPIARKFVDPWGVEYSITATNFSEPPAKRSYKLKILSAGEDGKFGTSDDVELQREIKPSQ